MKILTWFYNFIKLIKLYCKVVIKFMWQNRSPKIPNIILKKKMGRLIPPGIRVYYKAKCKIM